MAEMKEAETHNHRTCPVFLTLSLIANKWSVRILYALLHQQKPMRFGELKKSLETITQSELTKHLREFEKAGIVIRTIYPEVPPKVEYTLTLLGHSLLEPVEQLSNWASKHGEAIVRNRQQWEEKKTFAK
jgi:DNA-binding HxlR family transcriptional regulator